MAAQIDLKPDHCESAASPDTDLLFGRLLELDRLLQDWDRTDIARLSPAIQERGQIVTHVACILCDLRYPVMQRLAALQALQRTSAAAEQAIGNLLVFRQGLLARRLRASRLCPPVQAADPSFSCRA